MLMRIFVILFSTAFACIIVAMALEGAHNSLSLFRITHVIVLFGMIMSFPSMFYGYLRGSIYWEVGVRTYKPYLKTALIASITNGAVWGLVLGVPFMEDGTWIFTLLLIAFGLGGFVASAVAFALMQSIEKNAGKTAK
jgi:hypothetical protein